VLVKPITDQYTVPAIVTFPPKNIFKEFVSIIELDSKLYWLPVARK
jgi:hypothetical protein